MILVTGAAGQLGTDVISELNKRNIEYIGIDKITKAEEPSPCFIIDITDEKAVHDFIADKKPQCVIHCAAYTAVDKAEDESEICFKVNAEGTENIAKACKEIDAEMIYISTDYVFSGEGDEPYETDAVKAPLSVYGKSKLAGEEAVLKHLDKSYIVRISWVFGKTGNNFVKTMMKLADKSCQEKTARCVAPSVECPHDKSCQENRPSDINVVCDQVGSPTYTPDLAVLLCDMALLGKYGIYHATNEGFCS